MQTNSSKGKQKVKVSVIVWFVCGVVALLLAPFFVAFAKNLIFINEPDKAVAWVYMGLFLLGLFSGVGVLRTGATYFVYTYDDKPSTAEGTKGGEAV